MQPDQINFVDLFSGCGGLSFGIVQAALDHGYSAQAKLAVDVNSDALEVYRKNIPAADGAVRCEDISSLLCANLEESHSLVETKLKSTVGDIDFLVAGPPCQGNSDLNNVTRRNDPRNDLYLLCLRAAQLFQPAVLVIENVPTVVHSKQQVVQTSTRLLKQLGYSFREIDVDFSRLGVPQKRKRHILLATRDENQLSQLCNLTTSKETTLRDSILDLEDTSGQVDIMNRAGRLSDENNRRVDFLFENNLFDLPDAQRPPCHRDKAHSYKSIYGRLSWDQPAQTITSGFGSMGQGRYIHPSRKRTITPKEAARIQGFPDSFSFSPINKITTLREIIANAVPPVLTQQIVRKYLESRALESDSLEKLQA